MGMLFVTRGSGGILECLFRRRKEKWRVERWIVRLSRGLIASRRFLESRECRSQILVCDELRRPFGGTVCLFYRSQSPPPSPFRWKDLAFESPSFFRRFF